MANRKGKNNRELIAKLVSEADQRIPCAFCNREVDDEVIYGKLYAIGGIQIHYFCALLSCCLIQKAKDDVGLFGFLYSDILAEVERSKKHKCSYCGRGGANLGCSVGQCRKQFHLPCGRERNAVSMFFGNYKSFCQLHAPKQKIPDNIMAKVKLRMPSKKKKDEKIKEEILTEIKDEKTEDGAQSSDGAVCVICYEAVFAGPSVTTFWPPCCASDAWFHRNCLQRMALSAGMHYLKCPLCNDKANFQKAVAEQGYYLPDRDAAWELEQNAFAEIYERSISCTVETCLCPEGRSYDSDQGDWDIKLCLLCGTQSAHAHCAGAAERFVCGVCAPAAPADLAALAARVQAVILQEQSQPRSTRQRPVMPSRMSLRRTKQRMIPQASTSSSCSIRDKSPQNYNETAPLSTTVLSRQELNINPPRPPKKLFETNTQTIENNLISPLKLLEQGLNEKMSRTDLRENISLNSSFVIELMRQKFKKPKPLSEKRRIINEILEGLFANMGKESPKSKEPTLEWTSPRKLQNYFEDSEAIILTVPTTPKKELQETTIPNDNIVFIENVKPNIECMETDQKDVSADVICLEDEESRSTFELAPEFIAEDSDNSIPILETPQKTTTIIDIRKDSSLEISEHEESVKIDVITIDGKSPETNPERTKCAFKFSPVDNETLWSKNVNLDVECFKNEYLSEVKKEDVKCNFGHKHIDSVNEHVKLRTALDFAMDAAMKENNSDQKSLKRKLDMDETVSEKPRGQSTKENKTELLKHKNKRRRRNKKLKTKLSVHNKDIKLRIRFKEKQFKLKISQKKSKKKRTELVPKKMQQYVLQYDATNLKEQIAKPDNNVTPMKKKKIKNEKTPDNLVQTSIQRFFVMKYPKNEFGNREENG